MPFALPETEGSIRCCGISVVCVGKDPAVRGHLSGRREKILEYVNLRRYRYVLRVSRPVKTLYEAALSIGREQQTLHRTN